MKSAYEAFKVSLERKQPAKPAFYTVNKEILRRMQSHAPKNAAKCATLVEEEAGLTEARRFVHQKTYRGPSGTPDRTRFHYSKADTIITRLPEKVKQITHTRYSIGIEKKLERLEEKIDTYQSRRMRSVDPPTNAYAPLKEYAKLVSEHLKFPSIYSSVNEMARTLRCDQKINEGCRQESIRMRDEMAKAQRRFKKRADTSFH